MRTNHGTLAHQYILYILPLLRQYSFFELQLLKRFMTYQFTKRTWFGWTLLIHVIDTTQHRIELGLEFHEMIEILNRSTQFVVMNRIGLPLWGEQTHRKQQYYTYNYHKYYTNWLNIYLLLIEVHSILMYIRAHWAILAEIGWLIYCFVSIWSFPG